MLNCQARRLRLTLTMRGSVPWWAVVLLFVFAAGILQAG